MDDRFWLDRWQSNTILGFHEGRANALLERYFPALHLAPGARVFVPLCGKTRDVHWLRAQGCEVTGCELSPVAARQLFAELGATPDVTAAGGLQCLTVPGVRVLVGNIFDLDRATLGPVDAVYDRAALVALPATVRPRYAAHLMELTQTARQFLVCLEYDQSRTDGPPFSVSAAEVRSRYAAAYRTTCLEDRDVEGGLRGVCPMRESAWLLEPR